MIMGKTLLLLFILLSGSLTVASENLRFHENGSFKIVQFTDLHYIYGDKRADVVLLCLNEVLDAEKPDLVLLAGDLIYGRPAAKGLRTILDLVASRHIPFGVVFGNRPVKKGVAGHYICLSRESYRMPGRYSWCNQLCIACLFGRRRKSVRCVVLHGFKHLFLSVRYSRI